MKKLLSLVLALALVCALMVTVHAESAPTVLQVSVPSSLREGAKIPVFLTLPEAPDAATGRVIMIHGHGGNHNEWGGFDAISGGVAEAGKIVATLDFPGCGDSAESFQLNTMTNMKQDVLDVIAYVQETYGVDDVAAFGYSMGGRIILELLAEEKAAFSAVEFVAPAEDYEDLKGLFGGPEAWEELSKTAHEEGFVVFTTIYGQVQELSAAWFDDLAKYPDGLAEAAKAKYEGSAIVIYATDDEAVHPDISQGVADVFGCKVINTYTAGHSYSFYSDDPDVVSTVNGNSIAYLADPAAFLAE